MRAMAPANNTWNEAGGLEHISDTKHRVPDATLGMKFCRLGGVAYAWFIQPIDRP